MTYLALLDGEATKQRLLDAITLISEVIIKHRVKYAPLLDRLELELKDFRKNDEALSRARRQLTDLEEKGMGTTSEVSEDVLAVARALGKLRAGIDHREMQESKSDEGPMITKQNPYTQAAITRAIKAAMTAGLVVIGVRPDGTVLTEMPGSKAQVSPRLRDAREKLRK